MAIGRSGWTGIFGTCLSHEKNPRPPPEVGAAGSVGWLSERYMSEVSSRPARRHRRLPGSMRHEHVHIEHMPFGASREIIEAFHMYSGETLSLQPGSWAG